MTKYGIAKKGFGKALRKNYVVGGSVVKAVKGLVKKSGSNVKLEKEFYANKKIVDEGKLSALGKKGDKLRAETDAVLEKNKGTKFSDLKKSERAEEIEAINKLNKAIGPTTKDEIKGDISTRFATFRGKKVPGKNFMERAENGNKMLTKDK